MQIPGTPFWICHVRFNASLWVCERDEFLPHLRRMSAAPIQGYGCWWQPEARGTLTFIQWKLIKISGYVSAQSLQLCPTLCNPVDCSLPGSSVHGILLARTVEWVAMPSSRGSSSSWDQTHVCCVSWIAGRFFTHWATLDAQSLDKTVKFKKKFLVILTNRQDINRYPSLIAEATVAQGQTLNWT